MSDLSGNDLTEGLRMLQAGQLAAAAEYFSNIVQSDSSNGPAFGYLGIALTRLGRRIRRCKRSATHRNYSHKSLQRSTMLQ